jgi:CheY-like chemotaxis protein
MMFTFWAGILIRGFEEQGYCVDATGDGAEALWLATGSSYDTIVLDVMPPSLDGLEVTRRLRAGGRWAPVLLKPFSLAELEHDWGSAYHPASNLDEGGA